MKRGPQRGAVRADFVAKATAAWGDPPDWVVILAEECSARGQSAVAKAIGYSPATVSYVLANKYAGGIERVAEKVRGALMGAWVTCPILGEIGRDRCLDEQKMPRSAASSIRSKLYRACRSGCPHSRIGKGAGA